MGKAIGIDLGTTNTAVAVMVDGRPRVIEDSKGYKVMPSCITVRPDGSRLVGHAAHGLIITQPESTAYATKRLMGRRFDSHEVTETRQRMAYRIDPAQDGTCLLGLGNETLSPVEVSAELLKAARDMVEAALAEEVDEAVITVPAYFNHAQRAATLEAARTAGLRCDRLLNEPTAAALAYGFRKDLDRTLVIFDLGGGTFDISVLRISDGVYEILSSRGDTYLGGEDIDFRIVNHLADQFQNVHGVDLRQDRAALQRLKDACERAKCELSFTDQTTVLVPRITSGANLEQKLTRLTLESLCEDLLERTLDVTRKAIADAGLQYSNIDDVILVGGQTRMPRVREMISGLFGMQPSRGVHPEEVVAIGAAVQAASLAEPAAHHHVLLDVTPFDLGIDVAGGLFQPVIPRSTHVPAQVTRVFATAHDQQDSVRVTVRQGDSRFASENEFLGEFVMSGLTPAARMATKVSIAFRIDNNGMLHVSAHEPKTGEQRVVTVRNYAEVAAGAGGIKAELEGDGMDQSVQAKAARHIAGGPHDARQAPAATPGVAAKAGLLGGLFGKAASQHAAPPAAPAPPTRAAPVAPVVPTPVSPTYAAPMPAKIPPLAPAPMGASTIKLPDAMVPFEDDDALVALDPLESVVSRAPDVRSRPAAIGMAGDVLGYEDDDQFAAPGGLSLSASYTGDAPGYDQPFDDLFALPEDDDVEHRPAPRPPAGRRGLDQSMSGSMPFVMPEDESAAPVSLAGDDLFALPDDEMPLSLPGDALFAMAEEDGPMAAPPRKPNLANDGGEDLFGLTEDVAPLFGAADLYSKAADLGESTGSGGFSIPEDELFGSASLPGGADDDGRGVRPAMRAQDPRQERGIGGLSVPATEDLFSMHSVFDAGRGGDVTRQPHEDQAVTAPPSEGADDPFSDLGMDFANLGHDDDDTGLFHRPHQNAERKRKPAKLKLAYRQADAMVAEYRENLRRGGCFVKTPKPLPVGRECVIEVRAPGLDEPLRLRGVVTWSSSDQDQLLVGQDPGMGIEYQLDDTYRQQIERALASLA
jgi:molecular chaperone DnaK